MEQLRKMLLKSKTYFILLILWLIFLCIPILIFSKENSFIAVNIHRSLFMDILATGFTAMGDGLFVIALIIILFLCKRRLISINLLASYLISGLVAQILKHIFPLPRPFGVIKDHIVYTAPWSHLHTWGSFPSGHTTSAFAAATTICLFTKSKKLKIVVFCMACMTAYSRVYLGQHFIEDVWFGTLFGTLSSIFCFMIFLAWVKHRESKQSIKSNLFEYDF